MGKQVDEIRSAGGKYVERARRAGLDAVTIVSGDIVRELGLQNRTPSVCAALVSKRFLEENALTLKVTEGPPSGQSTTMKYTYVLHGVTAAATDGDGLLALRGVGREAFKELGGGEAFLTAERSAFEIS